MKKIFAFILATIMVVSLVPASVFAALSNDPGCEKVHTLTNCDYTQIGEPVAPTCKGDGQPGYTVYKCNKCGEQFLANFIDAPKHQWVTDADSKHTDTTGTCNIDGVKATTKWEKCSVCGDVGETACTKKDCNCGKGYNTYEVKHNLVYKSGDGCATIYNCTVCKKDYYKDSEGNATQEIAKIGHEWKYTSTLEEPYYDEKGNPVNGLARFTCKKCDDTKDFEILAEHECNFERVTGYVATSCTAPGAYAVYQCAKCLEVQYWTETFDDKGKLTGKGEQVTLKEGEANVIPMIPHDLKSSTPVPGKCEVTGECRICGNKKAVNPNPDGHMNLVETPIKDATCVTIGYKAVACSWCHYSNIEIIPVVGHKGADGKSVTIEVPVATPTCSEKGTTLVLCPLANCGSTVQYKGSNQYTHEGKTYTVVQVKTTNYDKTEKGHNMVESTISAASCTVNGIKIVYCANNCTEYPYSVEIINAPGHYNVTVEKNYCTTDAYANVKYFYTKIETCVTCGNVNVIEDKEIPAVKQFDSPDEAELFHGLVEKVTSPVFNDKKEVTSYKTEYKPVADATHKLETLKEFDATCINIGYSNLFCTNCGDTCVAIEAKLPHSDKDKVQGATAATCTKDGNTGYYTCDTPGCGAYFTEVDGEQVILSSKKGLTLKAHSQGLVSADAKKEIKDCSGKVVGYYYECQDCKKAYFEDAKAEKKLSKKPDDVAHKYTTLEPGEVTNCETDGVARVQHCSTCNYLIVEAKHDAVDTKLGVDAETKYTKVFDAYAELKNIEISVDNGVTYITYTEIGETEAVKKSLTTEKFEHEGYLEIVTDHSKHDDKCDNTDALYIHKYCHLCGHEILVSYTSAHTHVNKKGEILSSGCEGEGIDDNKCVFPGCGQTIEVINHNPEHEKNTLEKVTVVATCVNEGYTYVYCTKCDYKRVTGTLKVDPNNHPADKRTGSILNYAQPGYEEDKRPCTACGYEGESTTLAEDENGLEILLSATVNGKQNLEATYGSIIELTVSLGSTKGVDLWGLDFPISYNSKVLEFIDAETTWNQDSAFNAHRAAGDYKVYNPMYDADMSIGAIKVVAHADDAGVTVKGTQELVKLYFKVKYVTDSNSIGYLDNFNFVVADTLSFNEGYYKFNTTAVTDANVAIDTFYNDENSVLVTFVEMIEADGKDGVNISDIQAIYTMMLFGGYDVAADIDADGKITPEDLRLIYNFVTGVTTPQSYFNPKSTDSQIQPK